MEHISTEFSKYWDHAFAGCPPLSDCLRDRFREIWFRIHSFSSGKRYPENPEEERIPLGKYNAILDVVLSEGGEYFLITTMYSPNNLPSRDNEEISLNTPSNLFSSEAIDDGDDPYYRHIFVGKQIWSNGSADTLLLRVANDRASDVLFVSIRNGGALFHPYDGGADVFIKDKVWLQSLKNRYRAWLSSHPQGL